MDFGRRGSSDELSSRYKFLKTIGKGSFGLVRLGEKLSTGERVAIKMLDRKKLQDEKDSQRVEYEIRLLTLLRHPNIALLHDVFSTDRHIYIVLEYCSGGELFDYVVARNCVKEKEARKFFRQLLSAVAFCHANFVVHRDIKPENILLDQDLNLRMVDFGLAKSVREGEKLRTSCGSPGYCPPEMLNAVKYDGKKADVWSMGIVLYVIVCGMLPFDGDSIPAMFARIKSGVYQCPPSLSAELKSLLGRMLVVDADKRASAEELLTHPWVTMDGEGPVSDFVPERTPVTTIDEAVVAEAVSYGLVEADVRASVASRIPSPTLAIYHLLAERRQRLAAEGRGAPPALPTPERELSGRSLGQMVARKRANGHRRVESDADRLISRRASIAAAVEAAAAEVDVFKDEMAVSAPSINALPSLKVDKTKLKERKAAITDPSRTRRASTASPSAAPGEDGSPPPAHSRSLETSNPDNALPVYAPPAVPPLEDPGSPSSPVSASSSVPQSPVGAPASGAPPASAPVPTPRRAAIPPMLSGRSGSSPVLPSHVASRVDSSPRSPKTSVPAATRPSTGNTPPTPTSSPVPPLSSPLSLSAAASAAANTSAFSPKIQLRATYAGDMDLETMPLPSGPVASPVVSSIVRREKRERAGTDASRTAPPRCASPGSPRSPLGPSFPESPPVKDNEGRRTSIGPSGQKAAKDAAAAVEDSDDEGSPQSNGKMREVKGASACNTTSSKPIEDIRAEIERVLSAHRVDFERAGCFYDVYVREAATCSLLGVKCGDAVKATIEICKIYRLPIFGLKWHRVEGDAWDYKKLVNVLQKAMVL